MSRFTGRSIGFEADEVDNYDPAVDCWCPKCGRQYNGSDSSGGHCSPNTGGCCESFRSMSAFDAHLTGPHEPSGLRRCLTPDEMRAKGWSVDDNHVWRLPAPVNNPWAKP